MSNDPLLTIEELAAVLRVPVEMAHSWEPLGFLPVEEDANEDDGKKYRQRNVVLALRDQPEIMTAVKNAMMAKRGIVNEPPDDNSGSSNL